MSKGEKHMETKKAKTNAIDVKGTRVAVVTSEDGDYISLTDMPRAKDGEFATIKSEPVGLMKRNDIAITLPVRPVSHLQQYRLAAHGKVLLK